MQDDVEIETDGQSDAFAVSGHCLFVLNPFPYMTNLFKTISKTSRPKLRISLLMKVKFENIVANGDIAH